MNPSPDPDRDRLPGEIPEPTVPASGRVASVSHRPARVVLLAVVAVGVFHLGFLFTPLGGLVLVWLGCLFALRRVPSHRWAFYTGLAIGMGIYGPQLYFFWNIFGPTAIALWGVLAFWLALFLLWLHRVEQRWGSGWSLALAPVLWLGIEFFRSELYPLRFAWFTAGGVLPTQLSGRLLPLFGVYGLGSWLVFLAGVGVRCFEEPGWYRGRVGRVATSLAGLSLVAGLWLTLAWPATTPARSGLTNGLPVVGIQLEMPKQQDVLDALNRAFAAESPADWTGPRLYMLGEYTFDGPVPEEVRTWCRARQRWLVAGGRELLDGGKSYNTAFVISTNGEVVFKQAKSVPIQFFHDGLPAPEQRVWDSPWGKLGLCICYDLSFTRVVDRLIRQGARALLVPAMDAIAWGEHQHRLNARMTILRLAEYRVPIFRVATSGFSQLTSNDSGKLLAEAPFPGQGTIITGVLVPGEDQTPSIPLDRHLAPLAVLATAGLILLLVWSQTCSRRAWPAVSEP